MLKYNSHMKCLQILHFSNTISFAEHGTLGKLWEIFVKIKGGKYGCLRLEFSIGNAHPIPIMT